MNDALHYQAYYRSVAVTQYLQDTVRTLLLSTSLSQSTNKTLYLPITFGCQCCKLIIKINACSNTVQVFIPLFTNFTEATTHKKMDKT